MGCLKYKVLEETDTPRLTQGCEEKTWCSGTCWCPEAYEEAEGAVGSREREETNERGSEKRKEIKRKNPCCSIFNVDLGLSVEHERATVLIIKLEILVVVFSNRAVKD